MCARPSWTSCGSALPSRHDPFSERHDGLSLGRSPPARAGAGCRHRPNNSSIFGVRIMNQTAFRRRRCRAATEIMVFDRQPTMPDRWCRRSAGEAILGKVATIGSATESLPAPAASFMLLSPKSRAAEESRRSTTISRCRCGQFDPMTGFGPARWRPGASDSADTSAANVRSASPITRDALEAGGGFQLRTW